MATIYQSAKAETSQHMSKNLREFGTPWEKGFSTILPYNDATGSFYRGLNKNFIQAICEEEKISDPRFMTFKEVNEAGYSVKKGAKSVKTFRYGEFDFNTKEAFEEKTVEENAKKLGLSVSEYKETNVKAIMQPISLFNAKDINGLDRLKVSELSQKQKEKNIEKYLDSYMEAKGFDNSSFPSDNSEYYHSALRGIAHSTIDQREPLDKELEVVSAEIFSAMKGAEFGILTDEQKEESAFYIKSWAKDASIEDMNKVLSHVDSINKLVEKEQPLNFFKSQGKEQQKEQEKEQQQQPIHNQKIQDEPTAQFKKPIVGSSEKQSTIYDEITKRLKDEYVKKNLIKFITPKEYNEILYKHVSNLKNEIHQKIELSLEAEVKQGGKAEISNIQEPNTQVLKTLKPNVQDIKVQKADAQPPKSQESQTKDLETQDYTKKYRYSIWDKKEVKINEYLGNEKNVVVPREIEGLPVIAIEFNSFKGSNLTSIDLPDSLKFIGDRALRWCTNLTSIKIPDSVIRIGDGVFEMCKNLTKANVPDSVKHIGSNVFSGCENLTSFPLPDSVTSRGANIFYGCKYPKTQYPKKQFSKPQEKTDISLLKVPGEPPTTKSLTLAEKIKAQVKSQQLNKGKDAQGIGA